MAKVSTQFGIRLSEDGIHTFGGRCLPPFVLGYLSRICTDLEILYELLDFWQDNTFALIINFSRREVLLLKNGGYYRSFSYRRSLPKALVATIAAINHPLVTLGSESHDFTMFWDCMVDSFQSQEEFQS